MQMSVLAAFLSALVSFLLVSCATQKHEAIDDQQRPWEIAEWTRWAKMRFCGAALDQYLTDSMAPAMAMSLEEAFGIEAAKYDRVLERGFTVEFSRMNGTNGLQNAPEIAVYLPHKAGGPIDVLLEHRNGWTVFHTRQMKTDTPVAAEKGATEYIRQLGIDTTGYRATIIDCFKITYLPTLRKSDQRNPSALAESLTAFVLLDTGTVLIRREFGKAYTWHDSIFK